jgi:uncharacterized OB-fold protein
LSNESDRKPAPQGQLHAWYSKKQYRTTGKVEYELVTGGRVETTEVSRKPNPAGSWDDYYYLGLVKMGTHRIVVIARPMMELQGSNRQR